MRIFVPLHRHIHVVICQATAPQLTEASVGELGLAPQAL